MTTINTHFEHNGENHFNVEVWSEMHQNENGIFEKTIYIAARNEYGCFFSTETTIDVNASNMKAIAATIEAYKQRALQMTNDLRVADQLFRNCQKRGFQVNL